MEAVGGIVDYNEKQMHQWYEKIFSGTDKYFLIFSSTEQCLGEVSMHRFNEQNSEGDLNIKIMAKYRNRGYAKQAIELFIQYLCKHTTVYSLRDEILKTNKGGAKLLEKAGFGKISENSKTVIYRKIIRNQKTSI